MAVAVGLLSEAWSADVGLVCFVEVWPVAVAVSGLAVTLSLVVIAVGWFAMA